MIPDNEWSSDTTFMAFDTYGKPKPTYLTQNKYHVHLGPTAFSTTWNADNSVWWVFERIGTKIVAKQYIDNNWVLYGDVVDLPLCVAFTGTFDQNGRPLVFFDSGTDLMLWWYDPLLGTTTTTIFGVGNNPFAVFDVKYGVATEYSDVLLFYIRDNIIYYRVQRDRYAIEYQTPVIDATKILAADMAIDYRLQLVYIT